MVAILSFVVGGAIAWLVCWKQKRLGDARAKAALGEDIERGSCDTFQCWAVGLQELPIQIVIQITVPYYYSLDRVVRMWTIGHDGKKGLVEAYYEGYASNSLTLASKAALFMASGLLMKVIGKPVHIHHEEAVDVDPEEIDGLLQLPTAQPSRVTGCVAWDPHTKLTCTVGDDGFLRVSAWSPLPMIASWAFNSVQHAAEASGLKFVKEGVELVFTDHTAYVAFKWLCQTSQSVTLDGSFSVPTVPINQAA